MTPLFLWEIRGFLKNIICGKEQNLQQIVIENRGRRISFMNKTELIAAVAEKAGLSKKDADAAVNTVLDTIIERVAAGDKVQLVGFGTFESLSLIHI